MTNGQAGGHPNVAGRIRDVQIEPDRRPADLRGERRRRRLVLAATAARPGARSTTSRNPIAPMSATSPARWRAVRSTCSFRGRRRRLEGRSVGRHRRAVAVRWRAARHQRRRPGRRAAQRQARAGSASCTATRPPVRDGRWSRATRPRVDADTLRGAKCYRIAADPSNLDQLVAGTTKGIYLLPAGGAWTACDGLPDGRRPSARRRAHPPHRARSGAHLGRGAQRRARGRVHRRTGHGDHPGDPVVHRPRSGCRRSTLAATGRHPRAAGHRRQHGLRPRAPRDRRAREAHDAPGAPVVDRRDRRARQPQRHRDHGIARSTSSCRPTTSPTTTCASRRTRPRPTRSTSAGAAVEISNEYNGAIYRCQVSGAKATPTLIGDGVHADVHVLRDRPGRRPVNRPSAPCGSAATAASSARTPTAIPALSPTATTASPSCSPATSPATRPTPASSPPASRTTAPRSASGDGVWEQRFPGDGGGIVFDPVSANRYFRQYHKATWQSSDGRGTAPVFRRNARAKGTAEDLRDGRGRLVAVLLRRRRRVARRRRAPRLRQRPRLVLARLGCGRG